MLYYRFFNIINKKKVNDLPYILSIILNGNLPWKCCCRSTVALVTHHSSPGLHRSTAIVHAESSEENSKKKQCHNQNQTNHFQIYENNYCYCTVPLTGILLHCTINWCCTAVYHQLVLYCAVPLTGMAVRDFLGWRIKALCHKQSSRGVQARIFLFTSGQQKLRPTGNSK